MTVIESDLKHAVFGSVISTCLTF